jgi:hypothetical protein
VAYRLFGRVECRLYHAVHRDVRHVRGGGLCCSRLGARSGREKGASADDFLRIVGVDFQKRDVVAPIHFSSYLMLRTRTIGD